MNKRFIVLVFITVVVLVLLGAHWSNPGNEQLYKVKRFEEKLFLAAHFTPQQKADYYSLLLDRRLEELVLVADSKDSSHVWQTASRYSSTAGEATDLIVGNNLEDKAGALQEQFRSHQPKLQELLQRYPRVKDGDWKFIEDDVNYLDLYIIRLSAVAS